MVKYSYLFKVHLFGPFLPDEKSIIDNYNVIGILQENYHWENGVTGLSVTPSENLNSISLKIVREIKNGNEVFFTLKNNNPSIREVQHILEEMLNNYCAILSISSISGICYYQIIGATLTNPSEDGEEIEGPPSEFLRHINYYKQSLTNSHTIFINGISKVIKTDKTINNCLQYFSDALQNELLTYLCKEETLLSYFKVIELISNDVAKKIKLSKVDIKLKQLEILEDLEKTFKYKCHKSRISAFYKAETEFRLLNDNILKEKINKVAQFLNVNNQDKLARLTTIRNRVIAHADSKEKVNREDGLLFREMAKEFVRKYLFKYYPKLVYTPNLYSENIARQFAERGGYLISHRFNQKIFCKKIKS
jgi:hypothetical protein